MGMFWPSLSPRRLENLHAGASPDSGKSSYPDVPITWNDFNAFTRIYD